MHQPVRAAAPALAATLATVISMISLAGPAQAASPGAPSPCAAASIPATDDYRVTWTRPTNDGGFPIYAYAIRIKGTTRPVVRLRSADQRTEYPGRTYDWTTATNIGSTPLTFQIRAINSSGRGPYCNAVATGPTEPEPEPSPEPAPEPLPSDRPFIAYGESSFLQSEVVGAPVNESLTASFRSFMATHPEQAGTPYPRVNGVGSNKWGIPHVISRCTDPIWKVSPSGRQGSAANPAQWDRLTTTGSGFHAPANFGSMLTGTNDSPFIVIDSCNGLSVWASNAFAQPNNVISVGSFGAFSHTTNGLDRRNPRSDSAVNERSRGVIPDSIPIRKDLMDWAKATNAPDGLGHTLEMFFVETDETAGVVHPMVGYERGEFGWGAEGTRIAVAPSVDLDSRNCSPEGLVIARTLQHYGTYIGDNSGGSSTLKAQQEQGGTVWGASLTQHELQGCIAWNDFVVIEPGWQ